MVYDYWGFFCQYSGSTVTFVGKTMYDDCSLQYTNGVVNQSEECCLQYYYTITIVDLYDDCYHYLWYIIAVVGQQDYCCSLYTISVVYQDDDCVYGISFSRKRTVVYNVKLVLFFYQDNDCCLYISIASVLLSTSTMTVVHGILKLLLT